MFSSTADDEEEEEEGAAAGEAGQEDWLARLELMK